MINTKELQNKVQGYKQGCDEHGRQPTYKGLSNVLGVSSRTVSNINRGSFNGHAYTDKPHITRCVSNNDFEVIQALFSNRLDMYII